MGPNNAVLGRVLDRARRARLCALFAEPEERIRIRRRGPDRQRSQATLVLEPQLVACKQLPPVADDLVRARLRGLGAQPDRLSHHQHPDPRRELRSGTARRPPRHRWRARGVARRGACIRCPPGTGRVRSVHLRPPRRAVHALLSRGVSRVRPVSRCDRALAPVHVAWSHGRAVPVEPCVQGDGGKLPARLRAMGRVARNGARRRQRTAAARRRHPTHRARRRDPLCSGGRGARRICVLHDRDSPGHDAPDRGRHRVLGR